MRNSVTSRPVVAAFMFALLAAQTDAMAADCKGNPNALGTGRVIAVDPAEHGRIGTMQYAETLPLRDHEVVLTFDDGPLPPRTSKVLDILASECVKATFFLVGKMATEFPSLVRRTYSDGHTIAAHTQTHSPKIWKWPIADQEADINEGFASVAKVLGDPRAVAPFSDSRARQIGGNRNPFGRAGIMVWSADFPADDWLRIGAKQVAARALQRLEKKGKGVLLLHDIHQVTVLALPELLKELKKRNYSVVHVVRAGPDRPKTATDPAQWLMHASERPTVTPR